MNANNDMSVVKNNIFKSISQDGLSDIFCGIMIILLGIQIHYDISLAVFIGFLLFLAIKPIRNKLIIPRLGYVEVEGQNIFTFKSTIIYLAFVLLVIVSILGVMKSSGSHLPSFIEDYFLIPVGLVLAMLPFIFAKATNIKRLYFYSLLVFAMFVHAELMDYVKFPGTNNIAEITGLYVIVFGAITVVIGTVLLVLFLKNNPVIEDLSDEV